MNSPPVSEKSGRFHGKGRVLCITSNYPRWVGDSTTPFVHNLARDLQSFGWQVDVLAPHAPGAARREAIDQVRVERFRYLWPESQQKVCYQGGALINLRNHRSNLLRIPAFLAAEWLAVMRRLITRRYDLVHCHWILPQGFIGAISAGFMRVPQVLTVHGGDVFALKGGVLSCFKRFALGASAAVTVNSSATESAVAALRHGALNLVRIPMGVTIGEVDRDGPGPGAIRERHRLGQGPLLVFVGRLVEEKGVEDLIQAVRQLRSGLPEVSAMILGDGQDRDRLERLAAQAGVADRVSFTGWVQPDRVSDYIAAADVFVAPSRIGDDGWVEAQGLTILEAMVAGTPVVATRTGGIVDSVSDGVTGLLVDERSPKQIADAVIRLRGDPELVSGLSAQGRQFVVPSLSREACAAAFDSLFCELITPDKATQETRSS